MESEEARVEVRIREDYDKVWLDCIVNGKYNYRPVHVDSIASAEGMVMQIDDLIRAVYRTAYKDGQRDCQRTIRNALGYE